ncbi:MAG: PAS domain-containing protein [Candidatus Eremiobacteraeota bacterium]|nr:PAS domain-containing protein [Candidatus Eremiobacteraeota bacterium]
MDIDTRAASQRAFADALPIMIMTSDAQGVITFFNQRWHDFTGQPPFHKDVAEDWRSYFHPDDVDAVAAGWHAAIQTGSSFEVSYRLKNAATGKFHRVLGHAVPIRDARGTVIQWIGTATDIEESTQPQFQPQNTLPASLPETAQRGPLMRVTITLPKSVTDRLTALRNAFGLSVSSIVEHAVDAYIERGSTDELVVDLKARGANRRRRLP